MPGWRIEQGDCLDVMAGLPAGSARLIFADPPYNIGVDYGGGSKADRLPADEYLGWCRAWVDACVRLLTPDGSLWVLVSYERVDEVAVLLRRAGLHRRQWITWYETFGVNCTKKFNRCSRPLLHMTRDRGRFVFRPGAVRRPSDRQLQYNDKRANPEGKLLDDVWIIPRVAGTFKERVKGVPTQLPLELLMNVVGCASDPGDLVVDPFSGSGTTGEACIRLGRRFLGIEKSPRFAELSRTRLSRFDNPRRRPHRIPDHLDGDIVAPRPEPPAFLTEVLTVSNVVFRVVPSEVTPTATTTPIRATIRPYSTIVAPSSRAKSCFRNSIIAIAPFRIRRKDVRIDPA